MKDLINKLFNRPISLPEHLLNKPIADLQLLALDFEMSSLNIDQCKVLSAGWVKGKRFSIDLQSAHHALTRASGDLYQSPVIHGISAKDLLHGEHVRDVLDTLFNQNDVELWVFHNANLDVQVLNKVCSLLGRPEQQIVSIDTMQLAHYLLRKSDSIVANDALTLGKCRERMDLPDAPNHNALDDATATLQLLYAQLYALDKLAHVTLQDLLHTNAVQVHQLCLPKAAS